jgi:hypothetical protein
MMSNQDTPLRDDGVSLSPWFANDGGPLIILPRELMRYWYGSDPPPTGTVVTPRDPTFEFAGTDYGRACDAEAARWFAPIDVGPGTGIVVGVGDEANGVFWIRLPQTPGCNWLFHTNRKRGRTIR